MGNQSFTERRMSLLEDFATRAAGRHDTKLPLDEIAPSVDFQYFTGGVKVVDKESPSFEGGSNLAYDLNLLLEDKLIEIAYLTFDRSQLGTPIPRGPAIRVTRFGFETLSEHRRSWISKAIEKQPITFLQILATIIISACTGLVGWYVGSSQSPRDTQTNAANASSDETIPK